MGGKFKREGTYVYLTYADIWQKTTKFCKAIILQLKNIFFKKKETSKESIGATYYLTGRKRPSEKKNTEEKISRGSYI